MKSALTSNCRVLTCLVCNLLVRAWALVLSTASETNLNLPKLVLSTLLNEKMPSLDSIARMSNQSSITTFLSLKLVQLPRIRRSPGVSSNLRERMITYLRQMT